MWKRLTRWIQLSVQRRPVRRRTRLQRTRRGQLELLEARTVLSATLLEPPTDSEPIAAGVWASGHDEIVRLSWLSADETVLNGSASPSSATLGNWHDNSGHWERPTWGPSPAGMNASLPQGPSYVLTIFVIYVPTFGAPSTQMQSSGSTSEPAPPAIPQPIAATSPPVDPHDEPPAHPPQLAQFMVDSTGSFLSLLATPNITTSAASLSTTVSVAAREVAFQEEAPELLLLASGVEDRYDTELGGLNENLESVSDREHDEFTELGDFELDDGVANSLDLLDRELAAIDAALSELHSIEIHADETENDAAQDGRQSGTPAPLIATDGSLPTDASAETQSLPSDLGEGGMVLLEAIGDANFSVHNLADMFTGRFENAADVPLGVEMSVGVYQALDVGGAEPRPSTGNTSAVPASAARRSTATGEGDSSTASEQPS